MNQPLDALFQLHKGAIVGDVGHPPDNLPLQRIFLLDVQPRVRRQLLHAQRDALRLGRDFQNLDRDQIVIFQHRARILNPPPRHVGDMQQPVQRAEVHKRAIIGDVLDPSLHHLPLVQVLHQLFWVFDAACLQHGAPRNHDIAAPLVEFENPEHLP